MSTRSVGKKLENYALASLLNIDPKAKLSNNSGAVTGNGDLVHSIYQVECKKRNTKNVTVDIKVWDKLCSSIKMGSAKCPLLILENIDGHKWAVIQLSDFEQLNGVAYGKTKKR